MHLIKVGDQTLRKFQSPIDCGESMTIKAILAELPATRHEDPMRRFIFVEGLCH
jgi:hypothetical protein